MDLCHQAACVQWKVELQHTAVSQALSWKGKICAPVLVLETGVALNQPAEVRIVYVKLLDLVVAARWFWCCKELHIA